MYFDEPCKDTSCVDWNPFSNLGRQLDHSDFKCEISHIRLAKFQSESLSADVSVEETIGILFGVKCKPPFKTSEEDNEKEEALVSCKQ